MDHKYTFFTFIFRTCAWVDWVWLTPKSENFPSSEHMVSGHSFGNFTVSRTGGTHNTTRMIYIIIQLFSFLVEFLQDGLIFLMKFLM